MFNKINKACIVGAVLFLSWLALFLLDICFGTFRGAMVPNQRQELPTTWVERIEQKMPMSSRAPEDTALCEWYEVTFHDPPAEIDREWLKPAIIALAKQDCRVVVSQKVDVLMIGDLNTIHVRVAFTDMMAHGRAAIGLHAVKRASWVKFADGTSYP